MQWSARIGRRVKLHDLHVLMVVVEVGSMRKAAVRLNTTQPAVSRSIAELEHTIGARLLDRSRQGVVPTEHGSALLDCGAAVFDELRQGMKRIEFLSDPTVGHITVGGNEVTIAALLPAVSGRLRRQHPGISIQVKSVSAIGQQYRELRERNVDLIVSRIPSSIEKDIEVEILFHDRTIVVAGLTNRWAGRRKVVLSQLADEPWCLPPPEILPMTLIGEAFRASGMEFPPRGAMMGPIHLACALLASEPMLATVPASMLRLGANVPSLKVLPVTLPIPPWPVGIMTLKDRTLSPVTRLFIDCAREVAKPIVKENGGRQGNGL
jgi:DNA-binding transcriptional LysR family regulator